MSVSLCAANPQAGGWSTPLRRPLREGRRGPGRCYRKRPLRSSMRWREPVTASVLRMPTGRPCGMPVSLCAASPQAGGWLAPLRRPLREGRRAWAAAIASGPCAHRCGGESPSPPRYCCARLPSSVVGPSGLRARRGMASPGAVSSALRAARALRRVVSASGRRARVFRGAKARRAGLAAGVILITGRVRVFALQPARPSVRRPVPLPGRVTWPALATVCPVVRLPSFCHQASR